MKSKLLKKILKFLAKGMLRKHQPLVIGVTGSVGKSSAKEAIALALSDQYRVRKTEGNLNNEFGVPLTVFGFTDGSSNLLEWFWIIIRMIIIRYGSFRYPEALVLEMGIDKPGDMEYLLSIAPVDIGVVTHVSGSHKENFRNLSGIAREKGKLVNHFSEGKGIAILNADNELTEKMKEKTNASQVYTYGFSASASVRGTNAMLLQGDAAQGTLPYYSVKVEYGGNTFPLRLPNIVAEHHIGAALAAIAVALSLKLNLVRVAEKLGAFAPLPGRLRIIPGFNAALILDDSYNASPVSTEEALKVLGRLQSTRRIAVLGDMLELGQESQTLHEALAPILKTANINIAVLVGQRMKALYDELKNYPDIQTYWEADPQTVAQNIKSIVEPGDSILIKGSQGMRMEFISRMLLADETLAEQFLCRQSKGWQKKPFILP